MKEEKENISFDGKRAEILSRIQKAEIAYRTSEGSSNNAVDECRLALIITENIDFIVDNSQHSEIAFLLKSFIHRHLAFVRYMDIGSPLKTAYRRDFMEKIFPLIRSIERLEKE